MPITKSWSIWFKFQKSWNKKARPFSVLGIFFSLKWSSFLEELKVIPSCRSRNDVTHFLTSLLMSRSCLLCTKSLGTVVAKLLTPPPLGRDVIHWHAHHKIRLFFVSGHFFAYKMDLSLFRRKKFVVEISTWCNLEWSKTLRHRLRYLHCSLTISWEERN